MDEGEFILDDGAYIEDGVTYIPKGSVSLCDNLYLYHTAILDASVAEPDELMELKAIDTTEDSVLVCNWNKYSETYVTGKDIAISYGDVWVFTQEEVFAWGKENGMAEDMTLHMQQLIGLLPQDGNTHFSVLCVNSADMYRPSRDNKIDDMKAQLTFPGNAAQEYRE